MLAKLRTHISYANVTATLALIVALGGTAYAAATITGADVVDGSLTGADIKDSSLQSVDVGTGAIASSDLADHGITQSDLATGSVGSGKVIDDSLTGTDIDESTLGQVPSAKTAGVSNPTIETQDSSDTGSEGLKVAIVNCGTGRIALGGGYSLNGSVDHIHVSYSGHSGGGLPAWTVFAFEDTPTDANWSVTAIATCVDG